MVHLNKVEKWDQIKPELLEEGHNKCQRRNKWRLEKQYKTSISKLVGFLRDKQN
jgi:hypothetical protein